VVFGRGMWLGRTAACWRVGAGSGTGVGRVSCRAPAARTACFAFRRAPA